MSRLSRYLTSRRKMAASTTTDVHRLLLERGVEISPSAVSRWFSGDTRPDIAQLYILGLVLGFSAADFLHASRLAADDLILGETPSDFEPDPSVAPIAEAA